MPASPDHSPFIPPLPSPRDSSRRVVPTPRPEEESLPGDMHRPHPHSRHSWTSPQQQPGGWTPQPGLTWGVPTGGAWGQPVPSGYPPYARPAGATPVHAPHVVYTSPWPGYPPPPVHGPSYHSGAFIPGPLPHSASHGPTPYQAYHPMHPTPHSGSHGYHAAWGSPPMLDHDPMGYGFPPPARPDEGMVRIDKWEQGPNYGPVLTPFDVAVLDVQLHINPLLGSGDNNPASTQPYLVYNLLFPVGRARRSTDPLSRSWSSGRLAPATWPRVTKLNIISRDFPWVFEIKAARADRGVTCLDVIDGLYEKLQTIVPRHFIDSLSGTKGEAHKRRLYEAYHYNRSTARDAPGGSLGEGVRKVDWLLNRVMYDGIIDDPAFVQEKLLIKGRGWNGLKSADGKDKDKEKDKAKERVRSWPATFVLKLDVRYSDSEAERASVISEASEGTDETQTQVSEDL